MKDRDYRQAADRYLFFLGMACAISCLFLGPGVILVWIVTAICLGLFGRSTSSTTHDRTDHDQSCSKRKRTRR